MSTTSIDELKDNLDTSLRDLETRIDTIRAVASMSPDDPYAQRVQERLEYMLSELSGIASAAVSIR